MDRRIGMEIRELHQMIKQKVEVERTADPVAMTHSQVRVLMYIHGQMNPVYQKDLECYLQIRRSTATEILNVLEREEYIERVRAQHDARLKEIHLTQKTLGVIDTIALRLSNLELLLRHDIQEEELDTFLKVLNKMKSNLKEEKE